MISRSILIFLLLSFSVYEGHTQTITIKQPHYPFRTPNSFVNWTTLDGLVDSYAYPEDNVTAFPSYDFFINEINFDDANDGTFFIGAKNALYQIKTSDLTVVRKHQWLADGSALTTCRMNSIDDDFACHNHIRAYRKLPQSNAVNRLFVCGTGSYQPKCKTLDINNINSSADASDAYGLGNVGILSVHPAATALWTFQRNFTDKLLATGFYRANVWNEFDFARYNVSYNTVSKQLDIEGSDRTLTVSDNFHIDDPYHPLTLHRVDLEPDNPDSLNYKMYLFFFREKTFDSLPATVAPVRSRVIRICEQDNYDSTITPFFSSLLKAEIFCTKYPLGTPEAFGSQIFYYTGLRDTHLSNVKSRWYGNKNVWHQLMYAIFTSEQSAPNGTAICIYFGGILNLLSPTLFLNSDQRGVFEVFNQNVFLSKSDVQRSGHFLNCETANNRMGKNSFLAANPIQQYKGLHLPLLELDGEILTKITVDSTCVMKNDSTMCLIQDVLFVGTASGKILKIVLTTKPSEYPSLEVLGLDGLSHDGAIVQEWQLADTNSIEQLYLRNEDNVLFIYATTYSRIYKFPANYCSRHGSCSGCIGSRDPYCYWNATSNECVSFSPSGAANSMNEFTVPSNLYQNIHTGENDICNAIPSCSDLRVVSDSANGFYITGADTCTYTSSISLTVAPHGCHGTLDPITIDIGDVQFQSVNNSAILGRRYYNVTITAINSMGVANSHVYFVQTLNGAPSIPTSNEVFDSPFNTSRVQVDVVLDGCSLHSEPLEHRICVQFYGPSTSAHTICRDYNGINTFISSHVNKCEMMNYNVTVYNDFGASLVYTGDGVVPVPSPPNDPTGLVDTSRTHDTISLSWTPPVPTIDNHCVTNGYAVYVNGTKIVGCFELTTNSYTLTGLSPSTAYSIKVTACGDGGESPGITQTIATMCGTSSRIRNLTSIDEPRLLTFTWLPPLYIHGANIKYTVNSECNNRTIDGVDTDVMTIEGETSIMLSDLEPNTHCCVIVTADTLCESMTYTSEETLLCSMTSDDVPGSVENLRCNSTSPDTLLCQWDPPINYTSPSLVYLVTVNKQSMMIIDSDPVIGRLYYYVTRLEQNTEYMVTVVARSEVGTGPSQATSSPTLPGVPTSPENVRINFIDGCMISVVWEDAGSAEYSVDSYNVNLQCNSQTFNDTVNSVFYAMFNTCVDGTSLGLAWCSAIVFGINEVGTSEGSAIVYSPYPIELIRPPSPLCFLTSNNGNIFAFSYTITNFYALDNLYVNYSLTSVASPMSNIYNEFKFNGSNVLTFSDRARNMEHVFILKLCDQNNGNEVCSNSCELRFVSESSIPGHVLDLVASDVSFNSIRFMWRKPPNESTDAITYSITLYGNFPTREESVNDIQYLATDLTPDIKYDFEVRVFDINTNQSSRGVLITAMTDAGIPGQVNNLVVDHFPVDSASSNDSLEIRWGQPNITNGTITNYTVLYSIGSSSCEDAIVNSNSVIRTFYGSGTTLQHIFSIPKQPIGTTIIACVVAWTRAGRGSWTLSSVDVTGSGINDGSIGTNVAFGVMLALAIVAIIAAIVISILLAISCYYYHNGNKKAKHINGDVDNNNNNNNNNTRSRFMKFQKPNRVTSESRKPITQTKNDN